MENLSDNQCAIMFADIAGSTRLYNQLGDNLAELLISARLTAMQAIAAKHHGRIIKTIGDEIMCQFPSAEDAARAATEMHIEKNTDGDISTLEIRIGLHYGNTIAKDGDIYGDAVNIAARMSAIAKANQIITTEKFVTLLSHNLKSRTRLFDNTRIKGIDEEIKIYQVLWEENNVTAFATAHHIQQISGSNVSIVLKFNNEERIFTDSEFTSAISIGRDDSCDIAIEATYASRSHLNLEFHRGKFVLVDHSTNGTYVKFNHQDEIFIRREQLPLIGEGYISLGEACKSGNTSNIYFSVLQKQQ
jgi:class 3 adenylate cyclase